MKLLVKSLQDAIKYIPLDKTYGMRISSEYSLDNLSSLKENPNWIKINSYVFNDVWPGMPEELLVWHKRPTYFSKEKAKIILSDFQKYKEQTETLLIQCNEGKHRSTSTIIALNEIFNLGHDTNKLKKQYAGFRPFMYETFLEAGKEL